MHGQGYAGETGPAGNQGSIGDMGRKVTFIATITNPFELICAPQNDSCTNIINVCNDVQLYLYVQIFKSCMYGGVCTVSWLLINMVLFQYSQNHCFYPWLLQLYTIFAMYILCNIIYNAKLLAIFQL